MVPSENDSLLRLFASLWACTVLFSLSSVPEWFDYVFLVNALPSYVELFLAAVAAFVLFRPTLKSFLFLLIAQISEVLFSMPDVPNHRMLMTFISVTFLASYLISARKKGRVDLSSEDFFPEAIKISRIAFIVVYLFAALAKMNTGYVDPKTSCSVSFYGNIVSWFPFLPEGDWINTLSIYGPIFLEVLIPFGLLSKRFRKKTILVGLIFHFILALDLTQRFLNFSMVISVLYLLFLEPSYLQTLEEKWRKWVPENTLLVGFIVVFIFGLFQAHYTWTTALVIVEHILWILLFVGMFLAVLRSPDVPTNKSLPTFSPLQIIIFTLLLINGSSPYLGTKTRTSFNMYSNLRIEPDFSNHYFMGRSLDLFGNIGDAITIQTLTPPSDDDFKEGAMLTYFEFSRYFVEHPNSKLEVSYMRNGEEKTTDVGNRPQPPSWFARKLLTYRSLGPAVVQECIW